MINICWKKFHSYISGDGKQIGRWKFIVHDTHASMYKPWRTYPRLFVRDVLRGRVTKLDDDEFPGDTSLDIPARLLLHERRAEQAEQLACHPYLWYRRRCQRNIFWDLPAISKRHLQTIRVTHCASLLNWWTIYTHLHTYTHILFIFLKINNIVFITQNILINSNIYQVEWK